MDILITGATGFVGGHLARRLAVNANHHLYFLVRDQKRGTPAKGEIIETDLSQMLYTNGLPAHMDAIIHMAFAGLDHTPPQSVETYRINTVGTLGLLDYAHRVGISHFVYVSSGSVYGFSYDPLRETDPTTPSDVYGATKLSSEMLIQNSRPAFHTAILRLFRPYGPGLPRGVLREVADRVRDGRPVTLNDRGRPKTNPVFIDDAVTILEQSLTTTGHILSNVAGEETLTVRHLASIIGQILGKTPVFETTDRPAPSIISADTRHMRSIFSLSNLTPLAEGLKTIL